MADKKISELTELTTPDGTEELVVNDSGVSKKVQIDNLIADNGLSGDKIDGGTISNFTSTGIDDNATSTAITIDASENVGIGTVSPSSVLQIKATNPDVYITSDNTGQSDIYFGGTTAPTKGNIKYSDNSDLMAFSTNSSERMRIDSSGNVNVKTGNLVIGTSGKGIDFSAVSDGSRSVSSNLLDDYEEGTFTPNITGLTTTGTWATTITAGYYTKIGNRVFLHGSFYGTGGTGTGNLLLSGLPFASAHGGYTSGGIQVNDSLTFPTGTITTPWYGWDATHFTMRCSKSNAAFSYLQIPSAVNYIRFDINYITNE